MDNAMIGALLKAYGAPDTAENVNILLQHYGTNPTSAERKIYGTKGQSDESGFERPEPRLNMNAMIDKVDRAGTVTAGPIQDSAAPMVQNATGMTKRGATAGAPNRGPPPEQYGPPRPLPPVNPLDPQVSTQQPQGDEFDWWSLLKILVPAAIARGSAGSTVTPTGAPRSGLPTQYQGPEARYMGPMNTEVGPSSTTMRQTPTNRILEDNPPDNYRTTTAEEEAIRQRQATRDPSNPRSASIAAGGSTTQPRAQIPNEHTARPQYEGGAPQIRPGDPQRAGAAMQSPAEIDRIRAEVMAENAAAQALQEQMLQRELAQRRTGDLAKAARRATGRH